MEVDIRIVRPLDRIRRMTPREIVFRLAEELRFARERFDSTRGVESRPALIMPDGAVLPKILVASFEDPETTRRFWMTHFPESPRRSVTIADAILEGRVPLFSEVFEFKGAIDWHLEYRSGKRAPLDFYRDVRRLGAGAIGDSKNIWELNRHNFFLHLGKAYFSTRNPAYYAKWRELILSWVDGNPYNRGINWESSIELGIRAINWIWSSYFFFDELRADRELQERMCRCLGLHADHIYRHLSRYFSPNTHLTAEALGLVYIGRAFPWMESSERWVACGFDILERQLNRQVLSDGCYFEMATYYHKYTIDIYLHYLLLRDGPAGPPEPVGTAIGKLVRYLALLAEPDGTIPLLGDSDGGELLAIGGDKRNVMGACCVAGVLLESRELASLFGGLFREEALWLLGSRAAERFERLRGGSGPAPTHSLNAESGLFCFRTGMSARDSFVTIDCGPHGWGACGHAHADMLSYEWYCGGAKVVVDPGTHSYGESREMRDELRSSGRHNTITLGGVSQSIPGDAFGWKTIAHPVDAFARSFGEFGFFEGGHDGYDAVGCAHRRALLFFGRELVVVIDFVGVSRPVASLLSVVQCGAGTLKEIADRQFLFAGAGDSSGCSLRFLGTRPFSCSMREGTICPDYNKASPAPRIELAEERVDGDRVLISLLGPDASLVGSFTMGSGVSMAGRSADREYEISCSERGNARRASEEKTNGIVCRVASESEEMVLLRNARIVRAASGEVRFESESALEFCAAVARGGTLEMTIEKICRSFFVPRTIDTLVVNGETTPFVQEKGWIRTNVR